LPAPASLIAAAAPDRAGFFLTLGALAFIGISALPSWLRVCPSAIFGQGRERASLDERWTAPARMGSHESNDEARIVDSSALHPPRVFRGRLVDAQLH
jgi:hypothetical protein